MVILRGHSQICIQGHAWWCWGQSPGPRWAQLELQTFGFSWTRLPTWGSRRLIPSSRQLHVCQVRSTQHLPRSAGIVWTLKVSLSFSLTHAGLALITLLTLPSSHSTSRCLLPRIMASSRILEGHAVVPSTCYDEMHLEGTCLSFVSQGACSLELHSHLSL